MVRKASFWDSGYFLNRNECIDLRFTIRISWFDRKVLGHPGVLGECLFEKYLLLKKRIDLDLDKVVAPVHWYALRVTYCRELALKSWLDEQGIVNFVPMRYELIEKEGRKLRKLVPAVHNLVFVHTSRRGLESLCSHPELPVPVRHFYNRETRRPLVIPDSQMQNLLPWQAITRRVFCIWIRLIFSCRKVLVSASPEAFSRAWKAFLSVYATIVGWWCASKELRR